MTRFRTLSIALTGTQLTAFWGHGSYFRDELSCGLTLSIPPPITKEFKLPLLQSDLLSEASSTFRVRVGPRLEEQVLRKTHLQFEAPRGCSRLET